MPRQKLISLNEQELLLESFAEEYCAPCCVITEAGLEAIQDGLLSTDEVMEFAGDIFAIATEGMEQDTCYVIHMEGRWPELYSEEALRKSLEKMVR
jgi:hypothetical protein